MNLWGSLTGVVKGRIICADPAEALDSIRLAGICLKKILLEGELELTFQVNRKNWKLLHNLCLRKGYGLQIIGKYGIYWEAKALSLRPVLLLLLVFLMALTLWLPTRVLFFQVEGNETIPSKLILEAAEDCGVRFGASRRQVRSEKMKNALLSRMPQLSWAGINTRGCTAVISVRQRQDATQNHEVSISSIVAVRDGFITGCTVTAGNSLCVPGQTVKAGQMLISPYVDCGICIRVTGAKGEVYAQTQHKIQAVALSETLTRISASQTYRRFSLLVGKKRINLWKDSGISPATCGRIYEEYYITLPGGFRLPFGAAVECITIYESQLTEQDLNASKTSLASFARDIVQKKMIAGKILQEITALTQENGCWVLEADYVCTEMIGREISGKIGDTNEQDS